MAGPAAFDGFCFIARPGLPGAFGALMDEYARAAEDRRQITRWPR